MTYTYQNFKATNFWIPTTPLPTLSKTQVEEALPTHQSPHHVHTADVETGWCGDCGQHVPLLDEHGTDIIKALYLRTVEAIEAYRNGGLPSNWAPVGPLYGPIFEAYVQLTKQPINFSKLPFKGRALAEHLMKHTVNKMGPPCGECGHRLPTKKALLCTNCGSWPS